MCLPAWGLHCSTNRLHKLPGRRRTLAHAAATQVLAVQTCQRGNWRLVQGKHSSALAFWVQPAGALTWRTFHLLCGRQLCRVRMNIYTCGAHNACLIRITGCDMHSWQRRQRRDGTCAANRITHARILARPLHRCPQIHRCPLLNSSHSPLAQPSQKPLPGWLSFSRTLSSTAGWCPWAARSATDCSAAGMARQALLSLRISRLPATISMPPEAALHASRDCGWHLFAPRPPHLGTGCQAVPLVGPPLQRLPVLQLSSCSGSRGRGAGEAATGRCSAGCGSSGSNCSSGGWQRQRRRQPSGCGGHAAAAAQPCWRTSCHQHVLHSVRALAQRLPRRPGLCRLQCSTGSLVALVNCTLELRPSHCCWRRRPQACLPGRHLSAPPHLNDGICQLLGLRAPHVCRHPAPHQRRHLALLGVLAVRRRGLWRLIVGGQAKRAAVIASRSQRWLLCDTCSAAQAAAPSPRLSPAARASASSIAPPQALTCTSAARPPLGIVWSSRASASRRSSSLAASFRALFATLSGSCRCRQAAREQHS